VVRRLLVELDSAHSLDLSMGEGAEDGSTSIEEVEVDEKTPIVMNGGSVNGGGKVLYDSV